MKPLEQPSDEEGAVSNPQFPAETIGPEEVVGAANVAEFDQGQLAAQEEMAFWNMGMFLAAVAGVVLTIIGLTMIFRTLVHTRRAANFAGDAVEEAKRTTKAAKQSLAHSREVSNSELRAWLDLDLTLKKVQRFNSGSIVTTVEARIENIGKTPALRVGMSFDARIIPSAIIDRGEDFRLDMRPREFAPMMPGSVIEHAEGLTLRKEVIDEAKSVCAKERFPPILIVDVVVSYHTIFDDERSEKRLSSTRYFLVGKAAEGEDVRKAHWQWLDNPNPFGILHPDFVQDKSAPVLLT